MPTRSAGLLMYRRSGATVEVLLVHPGGPFWVKKDTGAWSIPKGEYSDGEEGLCGRSPGIPGGNGTGRARSLPASDAGQAAARQDRTGVGL